MTAEFHPLLFGDETERDYYQAVWYIAGALRALGAGDQVIPALLLILNQTLSERYTPAAPGVE